MRIKISYQLILMIAAVSLAAFGLFSYFLIRSQHRTLISQIELQADELSETIKSSTKHAMLVNQPDQVHRIIDTIGQQPGIKKVRIFNKEGEIIYSPDKALVGTMVDKRAEACYLCHAADLPLERLPTSERTRIFHENGARNLSIVNPIYNESSCSDTACHAHPASQTVLGVLDVTMSLQDADRQLVADQWKAILLMLGTVLAIGLIIWLFTQHMVGKPVSRLLAATQAVAGGDLTCRLDTEREDELGQLERSFSVMTRRLAETQSQLYQSNKLAALGRLAAGVAHEINNPLTGVLTFSSFLLKRAPEGSEARQDLETIVHETKRCREIVQGLLDFSRQVPPRNTNIDLNEIIDQSLDIVDHQLTVNNIRVTKMLREDLQTLRADRNQMIQVLINLLVNAADAIGASGGEIFISSDLREIEGSRFAEIKIADSGCGIPAEDLDRIFEPFFTTKEGIGTGLGLAVVWGIIEEHRGRIRVDSRPDRGTTFTIHLPVPESPALTREERSHEKPA